AGMTTDLERTNADRVAPVVDRARIALGNIAQWAREHPDEVAVGAVPYLLVVGATMRHRLSLAERMIVSHGAYWLAVLTVKEYRGWKTRPAGGGPRLRKVS